MHGLKGNVINQSTYSYLNIYTLKTYLSQSIAYVILHPISTIGSKIQSWKNN